MTTLANNEVRTYENGRTEIFDDLPMIADDIIYDGAAVGESSGIARPLVAADPFRGFCSRKADNTGGAASAKRVRMKTEGFIKLAVTGVTDEDDVDSTVYASDDNTFTLSSTGNSTIGKIVRFVSGTTVIVHFQSVSMRSI